MYSLYPGFQKSIKIDSILIPKIHFVVFKFIHAKLTDIHFTVCTVCALKKSVRLYTIEYLCLIGEVGMDCWM